MILIGPVPKWKCPYVQFYYIHVGNTNTKQYCKPYYISYEKINHIENITKILILKILQREKQIHGSRLKLYFENIKVTASCLDMESPQVELFIRNEKQ